MTLWLIGNAYNDREIADKMHVKYRTVKNRLFRARTKLRSMGILQYDKNNRKHLSTGSNQLSVYSAGLAAEHGLTTPLPESSRMLVKAAKIQLFGIDSP